MRNVSTVHLYIRLISLLLIHTGVVAYCRSDVRHVATKSQELDAKQDFSKWGRVNHMLLEPQEDCSMSMNPTA